MTSTTSFNTMLVALLPRLESYAMWLTRNNKAMADDLLQETAFRALRSQSQFAIGTNFRAWVYRILRNEYISSFRKAKRISVPLDELPEALFAERAVQEDAVFKREVIHAMGSLRPSQHQILELIWMAGLSYDEVAEAIGCSVGTVKSRLWRARKHMDALLKVRTPPQNGQASACASIIPRPGTAAHTLGTSPVAASGEITH